MHPSLIDAIGMVGGILTTVCWLPQAIKIIRDKDTRALSLPTNLGFTIGMVLWLVYGVALVDWPLMVSSAVTLALMTVIVALKLRHG
jgi:MtN3 and saliva related transmembrane protein